MHRQRLDIYDDLPSGMRSYLQKYGWHFSKKMFEWAVSGIRKKNAVTGKDEPVDYWDKEKVDEFLKKNGIQVKNDVAYDAAYVCNMARADYLKSSVPDEVHLAMFVRDYLDDSDGYDGLPFTRFLADCIGGGKPVVWEDMI